MNSSPSVAANLSNDARKCLAILSLSKAEPIAQLADREGVSRQFLYRQKQKAAEALDEAFAATAAARAKGMTEEQLAELFAVIGLANENNRLAIGYGVPVDEKFLSAREHG